MDKETRFYTLLEISLLVFFGVFSLQLSTLALLAPLIPILFYVIGATLCVIPIVAVYRKRKRINQTLTTKHCNKLTKEIQKELKKTINSSNIPSIAEDLRNNIMAQLPPIDYSAEPYPQKKTITGNPYTLIGKHLLPISLDEGKILAEKMTDISHNKRYRRNKVLFLLIP